MMRRLILYSTILLMLGGCTLVAPGNSGVDPTPTPPPTVTSNQAPIALYSISHRIPYVDQPVIFDANASRDADGWIVAYRWDLGPAGIQTAPVVIVTYAHAGDYPISLTVTDNEGATAIRGQLLTVEEHLTCGGSPGGGSPGGTCPLQ